MGAKVGIEVPILLVFFSSYLSDSVNTNFVVFRTCHVTLGYNVSECAKLGEQHDDDPALDDMEKEVQTAANVILMTGMLLSTIIPAIFCLFIGPWSDKHGRKPILLINIFGFMLLFAVKVIVSLIPTASPWFLLFDSLPILLTGGFPTFIMITLCYISDISTTENRGVRMAIFECMITLGILMGTVCSSYVYHATSYSVVFLISGICTLVSCVFTVFFVSESIVNTSELQNNSGLFSTDHIAEMVRSAVRPREGRKRAVLLLAVACLTLYILAINNGNLMYMYLTGKRFDWSLEHFTVYSSANAVLWIAGTFLGVYILHKLCGIGESLLLLMGFGLLAATTVIQAFATKDWHIYLAAVLHCMGGLISPMARSLISKVVAMEEVGKVFSLTVALESFTGIVSLPLYTLIYNGTIASFPGAFNLFGTAIYLVEVALITAIMVLRRYQSSVPYETLVVN